MGGRGPFGPNSMTSISIIRLKNPKGKFIDPEALWNYAGKNGYWPSPYDQEYVHMYQDHFILYLKRILGFDADPFKALMDASLAYAFSPKSTNEMVPTSN